MTSSQSCSGCAKNLITRERVLVVRETADLSSINLWRRRHDSIYLRLPQLTDNGNAAWEGRIQKSYSECGCTLGAYSLSGALIILVILFGVKVAQGNFDFYVLARISIILVIGSIVVGKLIGILIGRIYAAILIRKLQNYLRSRRVFSLK